MITAAVEDWAEHFDEVEPILALHWQELALDKDKHAARLDPQWAIYKARHAAGELMTVVLREAGRLVGYFWGFVAPGLHYGSCLTLTCDIFYVLPEWRKGNAGLKLFRAVEVEAKRRGVQRMFMGSKLHKDSSRLFKALGYEPVEVYHSKWIGN